VSALHRWAGLSHHEHVGKHIWILTVVAGAIILGLAIWTLRRRRHAGAIAAVKPRG
jgi:membrane-associated protein